MNALNRSVIRALLRGCAALALCLASAAALPCHAAGDDEDAVAVLAKICAEIRCYPPGTIKVIMGDGTTSEFHSDYSWPIVHDGFVAIYPGVTIFLAGEIVDGKIVNLRVVDEPATPVNVIKLRMHQEDGKPGTYLTVTNYFPQFIKYRAGMMLPTGDDIRATSSCAVMNNGRSSYEHWPHPIFQLILTDFHVADVTDGQIVCN